MRNVKLFLATVLILAGCSRSLEQPASIKADDTFSWHPVASMSATKTSIEGTTLSWAPGDKIGVFVGDIQENYAFTNTGANSFDGVFEYRHETHAAIDYYAYYPYVQNASPSTTMQAILPSAQTAPFDPTANFMVADVVQDEKYDEEDMPSVTFQFNNQLMSLVKVTVTSSDDTYSAQELLGVTIEATSGETLAGHFSFDIANPSANPVFSIVPAEVYAQVSSTFPELSRPTLGLNTPHSIYLLVNPVTVSSLKIVVRTTDHAFVATSTTPTTFTKGHVVSLPVIDLKNRTPQRRVRQCVLWGASNTSALFLQHMQTLLGEDWEVIRCGVGGDTALGIAGRQGGIPVVLKDAFTIPASNEETVSISSLYTTKNSRYEDGLAAIGRDGYYNNPGSGLNPVIIRFNDGVKDVEVEGTIIIKNYQFSFRRSTSGEEINVPARASVITYGSRAYKDADVIVTYPGINGGWGEYEDLTAIIQSMIDYTSKKQAVIQGFHMGYIAFPEGTEKTYWTTGYRDAMQAAFGANYLDLKTVGLANAYRLLVETGKYIPGQALTDADKTALDAGYWPQSFAQSSIYSDVHFNTYGYNAMAILVKERMAELGYLDY